MFQLDLYLKGIFQFSFSIIKVALQQFRESFLQGIWKKKIDDTKKDPINVDPGEDRLQSQI